MGSKPSVQIKKREPVACMDSSRANRQQSTPTDQATPMCDTERDHPEITEDDNHSHEDKAITTRLSEIEAEMTALKGLIDSIEALETRTERQALEALSRIERLESSEHGQHTRLSSTATDSPVSPSGSAMSSGSPPASHSVPQPNHTISSTHGPTTDSESESYSSSPLDASESPRHTTWDDSTETEQSLAARLRAAFE